MRVINQHTAKSPCQEHALAPQLPKDPMEEPLSELQAVHSLMQLVSAIKNKVQVIVENNVSYGPKASQTPMMDDVLVHLCSMRDGFPVLQHTELPAPSYPKSYANKEIAPCLLMSS